MAEETKRPAQEPVPVDESHIAATYANFCRVTGTPEELMARSRYHNAVVVQLSGETLPAFETIREDVAKVPGVARVEAEGDGRIIVFPEEGRAIADQVAQLARARGWELSSFHVDQGRMDEVFRTITIDDDRGQAA